MKPLFSNQKFNLFKNIYSILIINSLLLLLIQASLFRGCDQECARLSNLRKQKQHERADMLQRYEEKYGMTVERNDIINLSFDSLIAQLQSRQLKASQVLSAFIAKAINVTKEFNCVTEFIPGAMERAEELDSLPQVKGILHGLPIGVKDDFSVKGMDNTLGYSRRLYKPASESSVVVKSLEDLGAVIFLKTNVPQTLFSTGSGNPIFGETLNPLNKELTTGGSTSGGSCLVAAGALKITTGTDIGGSCRIPAHYTGISSIKTTAGRLSFKGIEPALPNVVGMTPVIGLLADKPTTLATVYKGLIDNNRQVLYDSLTLPILWNSQLYESKYPLRIGYFTSLSIFPAMGDTPSTILKARETLKSLNHTLIPLDVSAIFDSYRATDIYSDLLTADAGQFFKDMLRNDEVSPSFQTFKFILSVPAWKRRLLTTFIPLPERIRMAISAGADTQKSATLWERVGEKDKLIQSIFDEMTRSKLDLILSPVMPFPAPKTEVAPNLFLGAAYTTLWNLAEFPAGVVRFGKETGLNVSRYNDEGDYILRLAKDNFASSVGMPIGVQVIGKPFEDELVLRVLNELDSNREEDSKEIKIG